MKQEKLSYGMLLMGNFKMHLLNYSTKKAELIGHTSQCTGLAFSPVNNLLLCSCGMDGRIQFFDIATSKNVKTIQFKDESVPTPLSTIAFCYDGHTIAVGSITGKVLVNNLKDKAKG